MSTQPLILVIDDDAALLASWERTLRRRFRLATACGGAEGIAKADQEEPAVALVDARMPTIDGFAVLAHLQRRHPRCVRIMLSGADDQQTAVRAVNDGAVFRFLTKPCPAEVVAAALEAAIAHGKLEEAERELLEGTLTGSVKAVSGLLAAMDPQTFGRTGRLRERLRSVLTELGEPCGWELELAILFAPIGLITLPPEVLKRTREGASLDLAEQSLVEGAPSVAARLVGHIPRLEPVAAVLRQLTPAAATAQRATGRAFSAGIIAVRLLRHLDGLESQGYPWAEAMGQVEASADASDRAVVVALRKVTTPSSEGRPMIRRMVNWRTLEEGDRLLADVVDGVGATVVPAGRFITSHLRLRLEAAAERGLREPIPVERPLT